MDQEISDIGQSEPFILVTGEVGTDNAQYFICIENALAIESKTFRDALVDVIASYYVFDIVYPKHLAGVFMFFQHCVFGLKDAGRLPPCLQKLMENVQKL